MLDAIGAGLAPRVGDRDWAELWRESQEFEDTLDEIVRIKAEALKREKGEGKTSSSKKFATPFWYQLGVVTKRSFVGLWRSPNYVYTRVFIHAVISLVLSLSYLQLGQSMRDLQYRLFSMWVSGWFRSFDVGTLTLLTDAGCVSFPPSYKSNSFRCGSSIDVSDPPPSTPLTSRSVLNLDPT